MEMTTTDGAPRLMRRKATGRETELDAVAARVVEISTLPQIALRVIDVAQNPKTGAADLKNVVEGDPALSARVLRMVNSSAYALRATVTSLQQAISYLGLTQIRNLALTASVSDVFRRDMTIARYSRRGLWRHSVSVGICARLMARRRGISAFEDAFLAGLLHDIGIILIDQTAHDAFVNMLLTLDPRKTLVENERAALRIDHCTLGERVAQRWNFPATIRAAIRHHHAARDYHAEGKEIVWCVEAANVLCTLKGVSSIGSKLLAPGNSAFAALQFTRDDVRVLADDLDREILDNRKLFEI